MLGAQGARLPAASGLLRLPPSAPLRRPAVQPSRRSTILGTRRQSDVRAPGISLWQARAADATGRAALTNYFCASAGPARLSMRWVAATWVCCAWACAATATY